MANPYFTRDTFRFLGGLAANNRREWFEARRAAYEESARQPMLRFITDLAPRLRKVAPEYEVDPRPVGGSMMRIHRDVRFSKDKSPYKSALAAHFGHRAGDEEGAPAFYLHLGPGDCMAGAGIWRPGPKALKGIRDAIVAHPAAWRKVTTGKDFGSTCGLIGETLARAPKGYDPEHPLLDDLKRKDFAVKVALTEKEVCAPDFLDRYVEVCRKLNPFVRFLGDALGLPA